MRHVLSSLIWLLDLALKFALGFLLVYVVWLVCSAPGAAFGRGWVIAGSVLGACINGFFEGCDIFLLGWAKRVSGDR